MSVLLRLAYDGTDFHGWARQAPKPDGAEVRTVQGVVEDALGAVYQQSTAVRAASRTDRGVHARGQLVAFEPAFSIPIPGLLLGLTARLPPDVAPVDGWEASSEGGPVDPRRGNLGKRYRYRIRCPPLRDPLSRRFEWHLRHPLDLDRMRRAAPALIGEHDFAAFRGRDCQATSTIRRVTRIAVDAESDHVSIEVEGQAFLKNMVRIIVGSLVEVGRGRRDPDWLAEVLRRGRREDAGPTAPAHGLVLEDVFWPGRP